MRGGERGERLKAIRTLQEQRWWDAACPPPSAAYRPSIAQASPRLTMSSPSLASGTLCVSRSRWRSLSSGEIVCCGRVIEKYPLRVQNFDIWLRYDSRSGTHNMYQEYRDLTTTGTVAQGYRAHAIQIRKVEQIAVRSCQPTSSKAVLQLQDQIPADPPEPWVANTSQSSPPGGGEHLLLDAGPPCSLVCLNPLFGKTKNKTKNPTESPNT